MPHSDGGGEQNKCAIFDVYEFEFSEKYMQFHRRELPLHRFSSAFALH